MCGVRASARMHQDVFASLIASTPSFLCAPLYTQRVWLGVKWHPFTISSPVMDMEEDGIVSVHIRVHSGGWTDKLKSYLELMNPSKQYPLQVCLLAITAGSSILDFARVKSIRCGYLYSRLWISLLIASARAGGPDVAIAAVPYDKWCWCA